MSLNQDDILKTEQLYFNDEYALYQFQYNSFNQFIEYTIYRELTENPNIFYETSTEDKIYKYRFIFEDINIKPPTIENEDEYMFPEDARKKNQTYSSKIIATVKQVQEITDINTGKVEIKVTGDPEKEIPIADVMVMVRSNYCNLNIRKDLENRECKKDPGCYFIVKGNEKVVIGIERMCENKILVFTKKDKTFESGMTYYSTINSKKKNYTGMTQTLNIKLKKDGTIGIESSYFRDVPMGVMLRAYGLITDKEIYNYIVNDENDTSMMNIIRMSLNDVLVDPTKPETQANPYVKDQETAIRFLMNRLKRYKKFGDNDEETIYNHKKMYVIKLLKDDLLPHVGTNLFKKAYFICLMIQKLVNTKLGRRTADNRDSYVNKRVDMPGVLLGQLFKQYYKKMLNDIKKFFEKKYSGDNDHPINVINQIKSNTIRQGLINGLATGTWGIQKSRKGVSQALQRYSYPQTISYFRRIVTPTMDSATNKVTSIRHAQNNQIMFICAVETPEGQKIGLQKHLALMSNITIALPEQYDIVMGLLEDKIIDIKDISPYDFKKYVKVFVNGDWLGFIKDGYETGALLRRKRLDNQIHQHVSIVFDLYEKELHVRTDAGRFVRPLLTVENNELTLTREMLDDIDIEGTDHNKVNSWEKFMVKYPGVVEYVDIEESEYIMAAMYVRDLTENKKRMDTAIEKPNASGDLINRYNNTVYKSHTHCEFHPSMLLGTASGCIPCCEHNQAPRNIYNFSQAKQGNGIFATSERFRMDISYRLSDPTIPLVQTRAMKYVRTAEMPNGDNIIVAIMCYSGYNQEDSIIVNQSAVDRGLFRSFVLKKYVDEIKKNPSTSQDDKFIKPDPTRVSGIRKANYEKLNDKGYVDEETEIESGDVIIGKVSPIQPGSGDNSKIFKDNSQIYKSGEKGVIDKVYTGIYNIDGYEMYAVQVRSERIPRIGDKFSSRHGQKGTVGITLLSQDMPFTADGVQPDIIINPQCLSGDTVVRLANGEEKMIMDVYDKDFELTTVHPETLEISTTRYTNGFKRDCDELKQLTTKSGKTIKCTPDHKFLVLSYGRKKWKETQDIRVNVDELYEYENGKLNSTLVTKIEDIDSVPVYDFTTTSNNHSFIANGLVTHNCIPSRMTIGQLLESMLGKVSAIGGHFSDATPFNEYNFKEAMDVLTAEGYDPHGYETLYCGMTGKKLKSKIFIGPTFYMRLKHLVQDKIHARAKGPRQILTRQPPEGGWLTIIKYLVLLVFYLSA
jgi:DNA-directed RNA polymerase II subunit RPB2